MKKKMIRLLYICLLAVCLTLSFKDNALARERVMPAAVNEDIPWDDNAGTVEVTTHITYLYDEAYKAVELVNEERAKEGLEPYTIDRDMMDYAMQRAAESSVVPSHCHPYDYHVSASEAVRENWGQDCNADMMVGNWMLSKKGHRGTILCTTKSVNAVGMGCVKCMNGKYSWIMVIKSKQDIKKDDLKRVNYDADFTAEVSRNWFFGLGKQDEYYKHGAGTISSYDWNVMIGTPRQMKLGIWSPWVDGGYIFGWSYDYAHDAVIYLNPDTMTYASSNPEIFTVDENGVVTGKKAGTAKLIVSLKNLPSETESYEITVTPYMKDCTVSFARNVPLVKGLVPWANVPDYENGALKVTYDGTELQYGTDYVVTGTSGWFRITNARNSTDCVSFDVDSSFPGYSYYKEAVAKAVEEYNKENGVTQIVKPQTGKGQTAEQKTDNTENIEKPGAATLKNIQAGKKKFKISVKKGKLADGFELQYSQNKKFTGNTTKTVTVRKTSATVKKLKKGKTYYVRVRSFRTYNAAGDKVYSAYTVKRKIKIK